MFNGNFRKQKKMWTNRNEKVWKRMDESKCVGMIEIQKKRERENRQAKSWMKLLHFKKMEHFISNTQKLYEC